MDGFLPSFSLSLIYQFWVHTERIKALAAFRIRVQHAVAPPGAPRHGPGSTWTKLRRDPDHLGPAAGQFQEELFRPHYGLTKPVNTFNIWKLQTHEHVSIARDVRAAHLAGPVGLRLRPARLAALLGRTACTVATADALN